LVTRLIGQQEIVVKNVGRDLRGTGLFSGATILGDGKVAMILDVGAFM
jgi:two-component system chemotaxis sensor kinase CheA